MDRVAGLLARRTGRRGFLAKSAVVGSAIAANPLTYALKPTTEPTIARYAHAAIGPGCSASPSSCPPSPATRPASTSTVPPPSISYTVATKGSRGIESRRATNEPRDHESDATSMMRSPTATEPPPIPSGDFSIWTREMSPTSRPASTAPSTGTLYVSRSPRSKSL